MKYRKEQTLKKEKRKQNKPEEHRKEKIKKRLR